MSVIAAAPVLALLAASSLCAQTLVVRNVTVVDVDGARPASTVVIAKGRILSEGRARAVPRGATVIDGKGKFLIPALWDMHVHLWETDPMARLYVAAGVLGVRDMGSDLVRTRALKADILAGRITGPHIYSSGPVIDGPQSTIEEAMVLKAGTPEDARRAVDSVEKASADFVDILSGLSADSYQSVAQRARVIRMPFAGHLPDSVSALDAINARQKSIEHLFGIALACSPLEPTLREARIQAAAKNDAAALRKVQQRIYDTFSPGAANALFHRMARFGVWQTPTLTLWQRMTLLDVERRTSAPELKYVPAAIRSTWTDPHRKLEKTKAAALAELRKDYDFHANLVKILSGSGAGLLAGTDTGDPYVVPGFALHNELELLVKAGLTPLEALNSATIAPARYFERESVRGTVHRGMAADLILLDADPLADIRNTRRIAAVIYNGRLLNRKCLDGLLEGKQAGCPSVYSPASRPRKR